jgi:hypothetical protein
MNRFQETTKWAATESASKHAETVATHAAQKAAVKSPQSLLAKVPGKVVGKVAGGVIEPITWIAEGEAETVDIGLWLMAFGGGMLAGSAFAVGLLKALLDDATLEMLKEVHRDEPKQYRSGILPALKYSSFAGARINAMTIASKGGTAWRHPNGLWVYLTEPKSKDLIIYVPRNWTEIYTPLEPPKRGRNGYLWRAYRK